MKAQKTFPCFCQLSFCFSLFISVKLVTISGSTSPLPNPFCHFFATHLILRGVDIRSIQGLLGHKNVATTEIYTQLAKAMRGEIGSPLDDL